MIIIDGSKTDLRIDTYKNLEELLISVTEDIRLDNRVVTDVFVNNELFSELYPHQAEDVAVADLTSVEIRSLPVGEMAVNMSGEMHKVADLLIAGSRNVARLFRQADDDEALELLRDLLDVAQDFMSMLNVLRTEFHLQEDPNFGTNMEKLASLLGEMTEVMENQDWIFLADLLEYELMPFCEDWKKIIVTLHANLQASLAEQD